MTILGLYLNDFMRTGGQRRYLELMEALARRGNAVYVVMNRKFQWEPESFHRIDIDVPGVHHFRLPFSWRYRIAMRRALNGVLRTVGKIDWVHIHGELHLPAAAQIVRHTQARLFFAFRSNSILRERIIARAEPRGIVCRFIAYIEELKNLAQECSVARLADLVCFQSRGDEQDWLARVPGVLGKTVIIPGAISGPRFKTEYRDANRSETLSRLVYVGLVSMSKGITYLIEALGELKKRGHSELSLVILGRGGMVDACKRRCAELSIEHQVTFTGQVSDPFPYLVDADLMVYPSLYDAFPDAVLECLHVGIPVIASRIGGIPDILVHDELMFPIMNPAAIADRIEMLLVDPAAYQKVRTLCAGRRAAFEFDWAERWERAMLENVSDMGTTS